jgi:hypothetical protein
MGVVGSVTGGADSVTAGELVAAIAVIGAASGGGSSALLPQGILAFLPS